MEDTKSKEIEWINAFKGLGILGVIFVHFGVNGIDYKWFSTLVYYGTKGVYIMALISAFLIYYSLDNNEIKGRKRTIDWICRKVVRLIPLYYLALVINLAVEGTGGRWWLGSQPKVTIPNVICHLLFLHGFNPYYCNSIIAVEWYIGVLLVLYLIAPILHKYINSFLKAIILFMISMITCNYYLILSGLDIIPDIYIWTYYVENFTIISLFPLISLGIVLYYTVNESYFIQLKGNKKLAYFLLFFFLFIIYRLMRGSSFYGISTAGIWGIAFGGLIISQIIAPTKFINNIIFSTLGKYSYGIYLFHYMIVIHGPKFSIVNTYFSWIINFILTVCLSLGIAVLTDKFVEKPILKHLVG